MRTGLYPGTFDPVTLGHTDISRRASKRVDRLVIGIAVNRDKGPLFSLDERVALIEGECVGIAAETGMAIEVRSFDNLLVNFAGEVGAGVIIRGLRAVADFEYEFQMVGMNRALDEYRDGFPDGRRAPPGDRREIGQGDRPDGRRCLEVCL